MDPALMYQAAWQGDVDVISAFTTDGLVDASGLVLLEDDRHAIPPYDAVVLAGPRLIRENPDAVGALRDLGGAISNDTMRELNRAVDADGEPPAAVAHRFLTTHRSAGGHGVRPRDDRPATAEGSAAVAGSPAP